MRALSELDRLAFSSRVADGRGTPTSSSSPLPPPPSPSPAPAAGRQRRHWLDWSRWLRRDTLGWGSRGGRVCERGRSVLGGHSGDPALPRPAATAAQQHPQPPPQSERPQQSERELHQLRAAESRGAAAPAPAEPSRAERAAGPPPPPPRRCHHSNKELAELRAAARARLEALPGARSRSWVTAGGNAPGVWGRGGDRRWPRRESPPASRVSSRSILTSLHPTSHPPTAPVASLFTSGLGQVEGCLLGKSFPSLGGGENCCTFLYLQGDSVRSLSPFCNPGKPGDSCSHPTPFPLQELGYLLRLTPSGQWGEKRLGSSGLNLFGIRLCVCACV